MVFEHMAEDQQVQHRSDHRRGHRLETHFPETQNFLVEQHAPTAHGVALCAAGRLGTWDSQPGAAWAAMTLRNTSLKVRAADLDILHVDTGFAQLRQVALDLLSVLRPPSAPPGP